ncbi:MAG: sulfatase-like hydrolase/transferase, partial [Anaerolineae bacterium]|nr:sulfatase-like hydrolase/transferase [Anaerolineae bacterium]
MNIRITRMYSALCIFVVLAMALTGATPQSVSASASTTSPNIVLILTDDQDLRLGSMEAMPSTRALIGDQGMTMENFMVPNPLCCPARASLLRGQHAHNTQILYNTPPSGGFQRFLDLGHEDATVATALHAAGYRTALLGKYLNGYP